MGKPKHPPTTVVIQPALKQEVQELAKQLNMTFSACIEEALNDWLNKK